MMDLGKLFGRGIAFPVGLDQQQRVAWSEGPENIRQCIRIILSTEPGERLMLPGFGAGLRKFLFEPNVVATHRLMEEYITQALDQWEPRINLDSVSVEEASDDDQAAIVLISYNLVSNGAAEQVQLRVQLAQA